MLHHIPFCRVFLYNYDVLIKKLKFVDLCVNIRERKELAMIWNFIYSYGYFLFKVSLLTLYTIPTIFNLLNFRVKKLITVIS